MNVPPYTIPYDPNFLGGGITVPLPVPTEKLEGKLVANKDGYVFDYVHFSLAIHEQRHTAVFSACNIDGKRLVGGIGRDGVPWKLDDRVGDYQLGPEAYKNTMWDRGHLTRREDVIWGDPEEAEDANAATFYYTNAANQHRFFNQDEWKYLEDWVFRWADRDQYKLCVITGPVLKKNDRRLSEGDPELRRVILPPEEILIPAAFWKIIALRERSTRALAVAAFAMRQTDMWDDREGHTLIRLTTHQVTVEAIEEWTDLSFGDLKSADALQLRDTRDRFARSAEGDAIWPIIRSAQDIVQPVGRTVTETRSVGAFTAPAKKKSDCDCGGGDFDVRAAIEAVSADVAKLTGTVAQIVKQGGGPGENGTRSIDRGVVPEPPKPKPVESMTDEERIAEVERLLRPSGSADRAAVANDLLRIVGGVEVADNEFMQTCCVGSFERFFCTGVLVHPRVVVTAAHCTSDIAFAFFGKTIPTLGGEGKTVRVRSAVVHPQYDPRSADRNDINVLILARDAEAAPVKIAAAEELAAAEQVQLVGFGFNDPVRPLGFGVKRRVSVPIAAVRKTPQENLSALESRFGFSSNHEFVAGRKLLGRDSCNGDSGGPAFIISDGLRVAGVTSRATRQAQSNCGDGGIYVRLDTYLPFIKDTAAKFGIQM